MAGLKDITIATGYKSLLRINDNNGVSGSSLNCQDGDGNNTAIKMSTDLLQAQPASSDGNAFEVNTTGGSNRFRVNTANNYVTALGNYVNTQYAYFASVTTETSGNAAGYHYPLRFNSGASGGTSIPDQFNGFGNGTDPATSITTADAADQKASELVPYLMYVPDNISIDSIHSLSGADNATGDTTRFHCMSYSFSSGSTSCLTSGTLVAHSSDQVNAGVEQAYLNSWTIDSGDITAGKVLICTFESDTINSDYTYTVTIKYHLT